MKLVAALIFVIIILGSVFVGLLLNNTSKAVDMQIREYRLKNDSLKKATDSILLLQKQYTIQLDQQDEMINRNKIAIQEYENKIGNVNQKISNLKYSYDQANNHANDFSSVDLQRYFADSIR